MIDIGLKRGRGSQARAIIAPHGAWEISGNLAGAAFASAAGRCNPSRIVIMGPIHNNLEEGIFLSNSHSFQTPLGDIPVDQEASGWLESYSPLISVNDIPHLHEHSIEVLLPFVKYFFPNSSIVPILMGGQKKQHTRILADALHAAFEPIVEDTLLIVSFNLTVYPDNPAELETIEECMRLFREGKLRQLHTAFETGKITGCGGALVTALLQSTLLNGTRPYLASESLLSALGEQDKTVYYGAFSFV
ncbi:MAG: AmmeMemoRadiSam system protein B [Treponema sp.]|nr:AmmeMemoRadiSam system protein B [Treponema sp.]